MTAVFDATDAWFHLVSHHLYLANCIFHAAASQLSGHCGSKCVCLKTATATPAAVGNNLGTAAAIASLMLLPRHSRPLRPPLLLLLSLQSRSRHQRRRRRRRDTNCVSQKGPESAPSNWRVVTIFAQCFLFCHSTTSLAVTVAAAATSLNLGLAAFFLSCWLLNSPLCGEPGRFVK